MILNRTRTAMQTLTGVAALALCSAGGVSAAHADTVETNEAAFESFVADLKVDDATEAALNARFDRLSPTEQERFLDAVSEDPLSVMEFSEAEAPTLSAEPTRDRAGASRYTATYPVNVNLWGITTGTFNLRYGFEATSIAVTRNLECTGWFSGFGGPWSINQSTSSYISGDAGTCKVYHRLSFLYQGSSWIANKEQGLTYRGTTLASAWLKNI